MPGRAVQQHAGPHQALRRPARRAHRRHPHRHGQGSATHQAHGCACITCLPSSRHSDVTRSTCPSRPHFVCVCCAALPTHAEEPRGRRDHPRQPAQAHAEGAWRSCCNPCSVPAFLSVPPLWFPYLNERATNTTHIITHQPQQSSSRLKTNFLYGPWAAGGGRRCV